MKLTKMRCATALLTLLILITSCNKKEGLPLQGNPSLITAFVEQPIPETKTSLGASPANQILWSEGDKIVLFFEVNTYKCEYTLKTGAGTNSGKFSGIPSEEEYSAVYAFYPLSPAFNVTMSRVSGVQCLNFTIPSVQSYKEGSFANGAFPSVAYTTNNGALAFKNLCGLLKLQLKVVSGTKKIKKIVVLSNEYISGDFTVKMNYASAPILERYGSLQQRNVTLDVGEGVELTTTPKTFYIIVPPTTCAAKDFTVYIESEEGCMIQRASDKSENSIVRSKILSMPIFEYSDNVPFRQYSYVENGVDRGKGYSILLDNVLGFRYIAPVNCGYEPYISETQKGYPYGKLYQWGRKYGQGYNANDATFPSDADIVEGPVSESYGQAYSRRNKFFKASSYPFDWLSPQDSKLWNSGTEAAPVKAVNDPCPEGWRIPTYAELKALTTSKSSWTTKDGQNGRWFSGSVAYTSGMGGAIFFTAAGYRYYNGFEHCRGSYGYYWSSTPDSNSSFTLYFNSGSVGISNSHRAQGYTVRCIRGVSSSGGGEGMGDDNGGW